MADARDDDARARAFALEAASVDRLLAEVPGRAALPCPLTPPRAAL